jgi:pre-mRNA-processing factor 8
LSGEKRSNKIYIPHLHDYILIWEYEFLESQLVWSEYLKRRMNLKVLGKILSIGDINDLWNKGIPRINTLFQKDRHILALDHGWRIRKEFRRYNQIKTDFFWWTNHLHDGKLWDLSTYHVDVIQTLGGIENILEHTLFKGTFFSSWEGLFWEKTSGFETSNNFKNLTTAQRSGFNQIPNRRFTLWWSSTINRGNVYIGFQVQLDLTGIFMHGKIPTLKISFIQIFRAHLWQKIHESICIHISQKLDEKMLFLKLQTVQKETIHPRKSYKMNSSCADIILLSNEYFDVFFPSIMSVLCYKKNEKYFVKTNKFWIDLQLRWGNFDSHDIERYIRGKFLDYTADKKSVYPCKIGLIIGFDLAYNIYSAYGYWIEGLKFLLNQILTQILKGNPALFILRERIRKALQLYISEKISLFLNSENFADIFHYKNTWFVDDSCFYRVYVYRTNEGNLVSKPTNGVIIIFKPNCGIVFLKIFPRNFWKGQKKLNQFAKWKAAEEVSKFLNKIPLKYHPQLMIAIRKNLIDPLGIHLICYPNIVIKGSEIKISFYSLLQIEKIANKIKKTSFYNLLIYTLYDDWLNFISAFTCFSRIILILRSLDVNFQKFKKIFGEVDIPFSVQNFWPKFSDQKWIKIEILLKNLIIEDFCKKKKIIPKKFSQNDIRNIIFGTKINLSDDIYVKESEKSNSFTNIIRNEKSMEDFVFLKSEKIIKQANWKIRDSFSINFFSISKIISEFKFLDQRLFHKCIFPKNIIKYFACLSNFNSKTFGILFGKKLKKNKKVFKIQIILIPPQIYEDSKIDVALELPKNKFLKFIYFHGFIKATFSYDNEKCIKNDILIINSMLKKNFQNLKDQIIFMKIEIFSEKCQISGNLMKNYDQSFIFSKQNSKIVVILTERFFGFFLSPKKINWNFSFKIYSFFKELKYSLLISLPSLFYNSREDHAFFFS